MALNVERPAVFVHDELGDIKANALAVYRLESLTGTVDDILCRFFIHALATVSYFDYDVPALAFEA